MTTRKKLEAVEDPPWSHCDRKQGPGILGHCKANPNIDNIEKREERFLPTTDKERRGVVCKAMLSPNKGSAGILLKEALNI